MNVPDAAVTNRLSFSLRGMLIVLTVACVTLGWEVEKRRRFIVAVETLQAAGHKVDSFESEPGYIHFEPGQLITRIWKKQILPSAVKSVVRDEQTMQTISQLTTLERLWLAGPVRDDWLQPLSSLQSLRDLRLHCANLTDNAIPHLSKLKRLENLWLKGCRITSAGIDELRVALPNCAFEIWDDKFRIEAEHQPLNGRVNTGLTGPGEYTPTWPY